MAVQNREELEESKLTAEISVYCDPRLKEILGGLADAASFPLSEYIVQILAEKVQRPDLAKIPRKRMGRRRKAMVMNGKKQPA